MTTSPKSSAVRGGTRSALRLLALALGLVLALSLAVVAGLHTRWGMEFTLNLLLRVTRPLGGGDIAVAGARGGFLSGVELYGVRIRRDDGSLEVMVDTLIVEYRLAELVRRGRRVRAVAASGAHVRMDWPLPRETDPKRPGGGVDLTFDRVRLRRGSAQFHVRSAERDSVLELAQVALQGTSVHIGRTTSFTLDTLAAVLRAPAPPATTIRFAAAGRLASRRLELRTLRMEGDRTRVSGAGTLAFPTRDLRSFDGTDFRLAFSPLAGADLERFLPALGDPGDVALDLAVRGDTLALHATVRADAERGGSVNLDVSIPAAAGAVDVRTNGQLRSLDLGAITGRAPRQLVVTAQWAANLAGPRASQISGPVSVDLTGTRVRGVRLDRARISGRFDQGRLAFQLGGAGAGFKLGGSGWVTPLAKPLGYDVSGELSVPPHRVSDQGPVLIAGTVPFRIQGLVAEGAGVAATMEAALHADASASPLLGPATLAATLDSTLLRWQARAVAASGSIRAEGDIVLGSTPSFHIFDGEIREVNAALLAGDTTECRVSSRFRAEGRGLDPGSLGATAEIESLAVRYRSHEIQNGHAALSLDRGRARIDATALVDGGTVDASASIRSLAPPYDSNLKVTFRDLDLGLLTPRAAGARLAGSLNGDWIDGVLGVHGRLECRSDAVLLAGTVDLRASRENVRLVTSGDTLGAGRRVAENETGSLEAEMELDLSGSRIHRLTLDRIVGHARLSRGYLDATLDLGAGPDSAMVTVAGRPFDDPIELRSSGTVQSRRIGDLIGVDSLQAGARLSFEAEGDIPRSGALRDLRLSGRLVGNASAALPGAGEAQLDSILVHGGVAHGMANLDRLALRGNLLAADGAGRIALPGGEAVDSTSFRLAGKFGDPEPLAPFLGLRELSLLEGSFRVTASGPSRGMVFGCRAHLSRPHVNDVWADSVNLDLSGIADGTRLTRAGVTVRAASLVVWPFVSRDLDASLGWNGREVSAEVHSLLRGRRPEEVALSLEPREGGVRGRLERLLHTSSAGVITLQKPVEFEVGKRLSVSDLVLLDGGAPMLRARGSMAEDGAVDIEVHVDSLSLDHVREASPSFPLRGVVRMAGTLTGTRDRPVADASVSARLLSGGRDAAVLDGRLRWDVGVLDVSTRFDQSDEHGFAIEGRLPWILSLAPASGRGYVTVSSDSMDARLQATNVDLSWFQSLISPRVARGLKGWVNGTVMAKGVPDRPTLSGHLGLREGGVELPSQGIRLEDGEASVTLHERTIRLEQASLKSKGTFVASGTATLGGPERNTVHIDVELRDFVPVNTAQVKAQLDGRVTVSGDLDSLRVGGELTLEKSTLYAEKGEGSSLEPVELSRRDRLDIQERFGVGVGASTDKAAPRRDPFELEARVTIGDNVWVRRRSDPIVALELHGDVRLRKPAGGAWNARGTAGVRTGRSYLSFLGRRFEMVSAQVVLPGPVDSASARLEARYHPRSGESGSTDVDVTAVVEIEPSGVTTSLRSEPYLDEASLLNYLATGEVQGGLESGTAYGLAVGSALGAVGGTAGRSLGLDVVEVTTDAYGGQTLGAGTYVNPSVYLGFRQPVVEGKGSGNSSTSSSSNTEFEVEVEALRGLLLNLQGSSAQYRFVLRPRLGR